VAYDFAAAEHLPGVRTGDPADPSKLPRQRRGVTPQMHGRYPDFDVLEEVSHWDEVTRKVVLERVQEVPPLRFFEMREAATLGVLCDLLTAQDEEPRIRVLNFVDEKLFLGRLDGFQFDGMPDDRETWRITARALDREAGNRVGAASFAVADPEDQLAIVGDLASGELSHEVFEGIDPKQAFSVVMRGVLEAFYSHPWAWNEIGFGGPAYPRGYSRFGSPHLQAGERETWEGREAYDEDPVRHEPEPPPES
jgi:hypothetical protein